MFIVNPIVRVCNCFMFCCTLLCVHSCFAIILVGKRELDALLSLSSWCLVIGLLLFLVVPWFCLRFVIVVFPDHTHLLFFTIFFFQRCNFVEKLELCSWFLLAETESVNH